MSQEATIRRGVRNARYAAIPNHVFEDSRLSMEARWLLGYLLSKPDNWTVVIGDIIKRGGCGRDKARKMIAELVEIGYAEREQQREDGKFGSSVLVIFDEPRDAQEAANVNAPESVAFLPQTDLPATASPSPVLPSPVKTAHSNNLYLTNTDSQNLREGVREDLEGQKEPDEDLRKVDEAFWRCVKGWPDGSGMPKAAWKSEWLALTPEERIEAARLRDDWLALLGKRSHIPVPSTYFREKLWLDVPKPEEAAKPTNAMAAPFGKLWSGTAIAEFFLPPKGIITPPTLTQKSMIEQGKTTLAEVMAEKRMRDGWPGVKSMYERARYERLSERKMFLCPLALEEAVHGFQQVHRDSEQLAAWQREYHRRGWLFPDAPLPDWIYFPAIEGEGDIDLLVAEAVERYREQISGYLTSRGKGDDHAA